MKQQSLNTHSIPTLFRKLPLVCVTAFLLISALCIGAGAADTTQFPGHQTVFVYEKVPGLVDGVWFSGANTINAVASPTGTEGWFFGSGIVEGRYENGTYQTLIEYPTASIFGLGGTSPNQYSIIGGILYKDDPVSLSITSPSAVQPVGLFVTFPNGTAMTLSKSAVEAELTKKTGEYKLQAIFSANDFAPGTPSNLLLGKDIYTVKVVSFSGPSISVDVVSPAPPTITIEEGTIVENSIIPVTIAGKPGETFQLEYQNFALESPGTTPYDPATKTFTIPNTGKAEIYVKATEPGTGKITIAGTSSESEPTITEREDLKPEMPTETPTPTPTDSTPTEPTTPQSPAPLLGVFAGLMIGTVLRRR